MNKRNYNKEVEINTKFGTIYVESLNYNNNNSCDREEEDRIKIFDSDHNFFDYESCDLLFCNSEDRAECECDYERLIKSFQVSYLHIDHFLNDNCIDYEFCGTKEEMIKYLREELNWENAEDAVSKEKRNEYINRIGDYYMLIF